MVPAGMVLGAADALHEALSAAVATLEKEHGHLLTQLAIAREENSTTLTQMGKLEEVASQYTTNLSVLQGQLESAHANVEEARADAAAKMTAAQETSTAQVKQALAAAAEQVIPCYSILLTRGGIRYPSVCYAMLCGDITIMQARVSSTLPKNPLCV